MYTPGTAYFAIQSYYPITGQPVPDMYTVPDAVYLLLMLLCDIFYIASIYLRGRYGARRREKEHSELKRNPDYSAN